MTISPNLADLITYLLSGAIFLLLIWVTILEVRIRRLTKGANGRSLEGAINTTLERSDTLEEKIKTLHSHVKTVGKKTQQSVRGVSTVRFNAFRDSGGNQSFASAFLNESGDGVLISSLYGRDRTTVYAKPVNNFKSEYELSREEKEALKKTREQQTLD